MYCHEYMFQKKWYVYFHTDLFFLTLQTKHTPDPFPPQPLSRSPAAGERRTKRLIAKHKALILRSWGVKPAASWRKGPRLTFSRFSLGWVVVWWWFVVVVVVVVVVVAGSYWNKFWVEVVKREFMGNLCRDGNTTNSGVVWSHFSRIMKHF